MKSEVKQVEISEGAKSAYYEWWISNPAGGSFAYKEKGEDMVVTNKEKALEFLANKMSDLQSEIAKIDDIYDLINKYKKLKSLSDFNSKRSNDYHKMNSNEPQLNGIACPDCGKEMYDSNPMMTLTSSPPKKSIHCNCGYSGYRTA